MMHRMLKCWMVALAVLLVCGGPLGCKKKPFVDTVEQTPYLGLPADIEHLFSFDMVRLRSLESFQTFKQELEKDEQTKQYVGVLRDRVGFDPWQQVDGLIVAVQGKTDPANPFKNMIVIARGRYDQPETMLENLRQWLSEEYLIAPPAFSQSTFPGTDFKKYVTKAQSQYNENLIIEMAFAFPKPSLMMFSFSEQLLDQALAVTGGQNPGLQKDKYWLAMLSRPDIGAAMWGTGNLPKETLKQAAGQLPAGDQLTTAQQYYYNLNFQPLFKFEVGLVCETIEQASALADAAKTGLEQSKAMFVLFAASMPKTVETLNLIFVNAELQTCKFSLTLNDEQQRALSREWEALGEQAEESGQLPFALPGAPQQP